MKTTDAIYHDPLAGGPLEGFSVYDMAHAQLQLKLGDPPAPEELAHVHETFAEFVRQARQDGRFRDPCRDN